jgi:hypothetical protein
LTKVIWNALIAVGTLVFVFLIRSASSVEHGFRTGWYVAHNDAIWFEVAAVVGLLIFTICVVKAYLDVRATGTSRLPGD